MRALWGGERVFRGGHWSFEEATFAPLPEPQPELWVGGSSERAIRRTRELGDVWHPSGSVGPDAVKRVKERYPRVSSREPGRTRLTRSSTRAPRAPSSAFPTRPRCAPLPSAT
jgi:alkanesulfonate monooxygenase SsuD/methylene tetrahydromethanopterin reductase-like flavin-dependent oxidoreductase (luciferase family)